MFINDVGQNTWEEIDDGIAGANYGWPATEGPTTDPRFRSPLYAYPHGPATRPAARSPAAPSTTRATPQFPADYVGNYFFADFCSGWISVYDPAEDPADGTAPISRRASHIPSTSRSARTGACTTSRAS